MSITLSCHFDFHHYPHDEQQCEMLIQSLSHRIDLVEFDWCEKWADAGSKLDNGIFSLPHFTLAKYEHKVCNAAYPCVKAVFLLRRHPDFHILHTYVPTVLIVILSWMSFWISPDATPVARVTLGVTSILTMATHYSQSTKNLPPVSYIKSLDIWMITCMVYVFAALLEFAIVYNHHNKSRGPYESAIIPPNSAEMKQNGRNDSIIIAGLDMLDDNSGIIRRWFMAWKRFSRRVTAIDEASRVLFPLTYTSFIAGYFLLLTGTEERDPISTDIPN